MGYNQRNDEIRDNIVRMRRDCEAYADALETVEQFNARLFDQEIHVVLADDCRRAYIETSLVGYRVRLRHGYRS